MTNELSQTQKIPYESDQKREQKLQDIDYFITMLTAELQATNPDDVDSQDMLYRRINILQSLRERIE